MAVRGNADLIAYFLLCGARLAQSGGQTGLIATNTLAQGDTREVGLDQVVASWHRDQAGNQEQALAIQKRCSRVRRSLD